MDEWFHNLPPAAQAGLRARMTMIVRGLPPSIQMQLARYLAGIGHANPVPSGVDGMGFYHEVTVGGRQYPGSQVVAGLGIWGALIGAVAQTGTQVYLAREDKHLQQGLQANALATDKAIQEASINAAKETQLAMIKAQAEAAQIAGGASVARASVYAPAIASSIKWVGLAVVAVAFVGGGAWFVTRKKK